jgi:hypothetical protein
LEIVSHVENPEEAAIVVTTNNPGWYAHLINSSQNPVGNTKCSVTGATIDQIPKMKDVSDGFDFEKLAESIKKKWNGLIGAAGAADMGIGDEKNPHWREALDWNGKKCNINSAEGNAESPAKIPVRLEVILFRHFHLT